MTVGWAMLLLTFILPGIRLDAPFSAWMVRLTTTAGLAGAVAIAVAFVGVLVSRAMPSGHRRRREFLVHITVLALLLGVGALINEQLIKNALAVPRPNIVWLAEEEALGMTPAQFYASMDKPERRLYLRQALAGPGFDAAALNTKVRDHWVHETGYSLPSGHAAAAMLLATYFLAMGTARARRWRWMFHLLPAWAVLVGWSRVLLGVHRPEDVVWGGLLGILLGAAAVSLSHRLLNRIKNPAQGGVT
ncbi:phosphatase PAP2 family protein [Candidatus Bipolaricaulota bacterium]|nr:phosphatase PAP2 family protein [Candidatus Bipolaricaulota bacterium]